MTDKEKWSNFLKEMGISFREDVMSITITNNDDGWSYYNEFGNLIHGNMGADGYNGFYFRVCFREDGSMTELGSFE